MFVREVVTVSDSWAIVMNINNLWAESIVNRLALIANITSPPVPGSFLLDNRTVPNAPKMPHPVISYTTRQRHWTRTGHVRTVCSSLTSANNMLQIAIFVNKVVFDIVLLLGIVIDVVISLKVFDLLGQK